MKPCSGWPHTHTCFCFAAHMPHVMFSPAAQVQRYLTQRMLQTAAQHNIQLKQIDYTQPLGPQGPFDVIIHKLRPNPCK